MTIESGITKVSPLEAKGEYEGFVMTLSPTPVANSRMVRGKQYPIGLKLEASHSTGTDAMSMEGFYDIFAKFTEELAESHDFFKNIIRNHGGIVITDFGTLDAEHFAKFINAFARGSKLIEFEQNGITHPRKKIAKNVTSVNKTTGAKRLHAHQEFSRFKDYPAFLTFFAKRPSDTGGDETIVHATELYDKINEKYPEFIKELQTKGLYLSQTWPYDEPLFDGTTFSWTSYHSFGRLIEPGDDLETQKKKAEIICRKHISDEFEFTEDNGLMIHEHTQPIKVHPTTKNPIFFSSLPVYYLKWKAEQETKVITDHNLISYDNGEPIPEEYLAFLLEASVECAVQHHFTPGDIVIIDNYQSYHGRTAYGTQERQILASFWDDIPELKSIPTDL